MKRIKGGTKKENGGTKKENGPGVVSKSGFSEFSYPRPKSGGSKLLVETFTNPSTGPRLETPRISVKGGGVLHLLLSSWIEWLSNLPSH